MTDIRTELEFDRELKRRVEKYKNRRRSTREEILQIIDRFREIGTPIFLKAADEMTKYMNGSATKGVNTK